MKNHHPMKTYFEEIKTRIFSELSSDEVVILNLTGDDTQFIRVNQAKVRQIGEVQNYFLDITYLLNTKVNAKVNTNSQEVLHKAKAEIALTQNFNHDFEGIKKIIQNWRQVLPLCPADPYATLPKKPSTSDSSTVEVTKGSLLSRDEVLKYLLEPAQSLNITGIYAAGSVIRALAHSLGLFQWFETETFSWDYSLYAKNQKAVKGSYSGQHWDQAEYLSHLEMDSQKCEQLDKPSKQLTKGTYRAYLAPAALGDIIHMLSWGAVSEFAIRKELSSFKYLRNQSRRLSPLFSLEENFSSGHVQRFNEEGDISPLSVPIIQNGLLVNGLVSARTAKEYHLTSNAATESEILRSPVVKAGQLKKSEILKELGTGVYLSNLHYLNWSDQVNGRITGMTRYACFWVENSKIVAPIENLRFDETLFDLLGDHCLGFTQERRYLPDTSTYEVRHLGGTLCPGLLLSSMNFTL